MNERQGGPRSQKNRQKKIRTLIFTVASSLLFCIAIVGVIVFAIQKLPDNPPDYASGTDTYSTSDNSDKTQNTQDTQEPSKVTQVSAATVLAVGDILPHTNVINAAYYRETDTYNFNPFFTYVTPYISKADYAVANLETTLAGTENGNIYSGYPRFNSPDSVVEGMKNAGFDLAITANNHCYDTNFAGLKRTLRVVSNQGLNTLGTVYDKNATKYLVKDVNGIRIGMLNYTYETSDSYPNRPSINGLLTSEASVGHINSFDYNQLDKFYTEVSAYISSMKAEGAEAIVFYIHWGNEYQLTPAASQKRIAQKLCDLGVDVIIGGHPHVIQPIELLQSTLDGNHKTVCLYSTGNFLSNQRIEHMGLKTGHTEDGIMFSVTFVKYSDGTVALENTTALPTWICLHKVNGRNVYSILPLDKTVADWQNTYQISQQHAKEAEASYDRTMALVLNGLTEVNTYLQQQKALRDSINQG